MSDTPLVGFLRRYGVTVLQEAGAELVLRCPDCGRPKLYLNSENFRFLCFRCEKKGAAARLLHELTGAPWPEIFAVTGTPGEEREVPQRRVVVSTTAVELPEDFRLLDDPQSLRQQPYWQYLQGRGLSEALIREYGMGYCHFGFCGGRVVVPLFQDGRLRSWVARDALGRPQLRKVLMPKGIDAGKLLFNLDAVAARGEDAVIVEGVFDALALPQRAVATLGKKLSLAQRAELLLHGLRRLTLAWDQDAWYEIVATALDLSGCFSVRCARLTGKDPAEMDREELLACLADARRVTRADLVLAMCTRKVFRS